MSDINNTLAANYKKISSFSIDDHLGNRCLYVRSYRDSNKWFNIAKCQINTDGHVDENDGLVPDAIIVHAEEVAYIIALAEDREERLQRIESLLEEDITLRRSKSRRAKQPKKQLQKKEVVH